MFEKLINFFKFKRRPISVNVKIEDLDIWEEYNLLKSSILNKMDKIAKSGIDSPDAILYVVDGERPEDGFWIKPKSVTFISTVTSVDKSFSFFIVVDGNRVDFKSPSKEKAEEIIFKLMNIDKLPEKETSLEKEKLDRVFKKDSKKEIDLESLKSEIKNSV